jgi:F-type H+-transporting ATPase subunit delta
VRSPTIAGRYALALLDLGVERQNFEQLGRELDRVLALFASPELHELFRNPNFGVEVRRNVLGELLKQHVMVTPICRNFLFLLIDRGRIAHFPEIVEAYHALADEHAGRVRAKVTVARRLSEPDAARLKTVLQKVTGREVLVEQTEDPEIIGGVITRIGGRVFDGSIRAQLEHLRTRLVAGA